MGELGKWTNVDRQLKIEDKAKIASKKYFITLNAFRIVKEYNDNYKELGDKILSKWDNKNILLNELGTEEKGSSGPKTCSVAPSFKSW